MTIRGLLDHVGVDTAGRDIWVGDRLVDSVIKCLYSHAEPCPAPDHVPCGPAVARIRLRLGQWIPLCADDLNEWFDRADADELDEPEAINWVTRPRSSSGSPEARAPRS